MIVALQTLFFFRESIIAAIDRLLRPYYKHLALTFSNSGEDSDDEESDEQIFAEFDEEKGVIFFPPVYAQRYAAVSDCLMDERWCGKLQKVVDFGYHDMSFIKYLKEVPGIKQILGVDIESIPLCCSSDLLRSDDLLSKRDPLKITLFQGNAADPDYRLIGCDAIIAIEMIEHMLPHDLERFVHTVFGFIKPWIAVITTPNGDFNPLFKALESNGLRRLDHFFEWSREQFHDWCTNILVRYPQYTVSCRGVGPGPMGTEQYGCCSQLALFVSKDYHKQQDLNINSLSLVSNRQDDSIIDFINYPGSQDTLNENKMIFYTNEIESYTDLMILNKQSCVNLPLSPAPSMDILEYRDKSTQCNLDKELGKSFLMFDDEQYCQVVVPRRRVDNRVYVIEDTNCRLNCTTMQVKKFSKPTQNLLAKSDMDSLEQTKDVVDEIRHLTNMLKIDNTPKIPTDPAPTWNNFNWGDNAPYWNQYYKIVKEFNYPIESKTEECRMLDLISDEINRLIDSRYDEAYTVDDHKMEIPIEQLMSVVQHITDDVDRVRDLLEWNGYEVSGDVVIHSRLVIDNASAGSMDEEWRDDDSFSDWDTDIRSTSLSEGGTVLADYNGRSLRRALDRKVRKLRVTLAADDDVTAELDAAVCRLMKLALHASRRRQRPLPGRWMQYKLLDLLTLTEKAIERKRQRYVEEFAVNAIGCDDTLNGFSEDVHRIKEDDTANKIVDKYKHLISLPEIINTAEDIPYGYQDALDDLSHNSSRELLKECESSEINFDDIIRSPSLTNIVPASSPVDVPKMYCNNIDHEDVKSQSPNSRIKAWVEDEGNINHAISSGDTDQSTNNLKERKNKKGHKKQKLTPDVKDKVYIKQRKKSQTKTAFGKHKIKNSMKYKSVEKVDNGKNFKKVTEKKSKYNVLSKSCSRRLSALKLETDTGFPIKTSEQSFTASLTKPIPGTFKELCRIEHGIDVVSWESGISKLGLDEDESIAIVDFEPPEAKNIAATEESCLIDIITENDIETIALQRTVGTDPEDDSAYERELDYTHGSMTNVLKVDSFCKKPDIEIENVQSQTIFLFDINEPSTSKGVRHVCIDAQCGPDVTNNYAALSATTSFTQVPKMFNTAIKIEDSITNIQTNHDTDFALSLNKTNNSLQSVYASGKAVAIKIKDSDTNLTHTTHENKEPPVLSILENNDSATDSLLRPVTSSPKIEDCGSELCEGNTSPLNITDVSNKPSHLHLNCTVSKNNCAERKLSSKYVRPKLSCGGVYVHSYKDREVSEDVIYLGEWQKYKPKPLAKKRCCTATLPTAKKRINSKCNEEILNKEPKPKQVIQYTVSKKNTGNKAEVNKLSKTMELSTISNRALKTKSKGTVTKLASKLSASSILSKKGKKTTFLTKKPSLTTCAITKEKDKGQGCTRKNYLPLYLRRKLAKDNYVTSPEKASDKNIISPEEAQVTLVTEPKKEDIKEVMLNFNPEIENISYVVFRNEIEIGKNSSTDYEAHLSNEETVIEIDTTGVRSLSPHSQNSSACSSLNSVATVIVKPTVEPVSDRKYSMSSNKNNNTGNNQRDNTSPKNKKFSKRAKTVKKPQDKTFDNKENFPQSSNIKKQSEKEIKNPLMGKQNVFRAQITNEATQSTSNNLSKSKPMVKSNIKLPSMPRSSKSAKTLASSLSLKSSKTSEVPLKSEISLVSEKECAIVPNSSNLALSKLTTEHKDNADNSKVKDSDKAAINIVDNELLTELMQSTYKNVIDNHTKNILDAMKQLVEERLDFIEPNDMEIDSETVVLGKKSVTVSEAPSFHDFIPNASSFGTAIELNNTTDSNVSSVDSRRYNTSSSYIDMFGNESIEGIADTQRTVTDWDFLSNKSFNSASEYVLAQSFLSNLDAQLTEVANTNAVYDIYERKTPTPVQNPPGPLIAQAFSGFSVNAEPVLGQRPDPVNIVDSETGSVAARLATSEEVFVSGRSTSSYESCLIDEDAVVPDWLFRIISQQESVDEEEPEELVPLQFPIVEPTLDMNGNVLEPGMGAGDGRGIHSDQSQDSSGQGTSLSSSATSSGPQSEAILIDAVALAAQYELVPLRSSSLTVAPAQAPANDSPDVSFLGSSENVRNNETVNSAGEPQRRAITNMATSDVDADVSSIDTDIPDSDN